MGKPYHFFYDDYIDNAYNTIRVYDPKAKKVIINKGFHEQEDDIDITIKNTFDQINGFANLGKIKEGWDDIRKTLAGSGAVIKTATDGIKDWWNANIYGHGDSNIIGKMGDLIDFVGKVATKIDDHLQPIVQKSIDTADGYMYLFGGTDVSSENSMSFQELFITDTLSAWSTNKKKIQDRITTLTGKFSLPSKDSGNVFLGITDPPNGFKTSLDGLKGESPDGTFDLFVGNTKFPGVVCESINLLISKTRVIQNSGSLGSKDPKNLAPLYVFVKYTFKPVIKYYQDMLLKWLDLCAQTPSGIDRGV